MPESRGEAAGARLRAAADEMLTEVERLPSDLITWQPAPDVWSVMDVLCHVQEFIPYWTAQALAVVERPQELWGRDHTDRDRLAAVDQTSARLLADVQRGIRQGVTQSSATLSRLTDAELETEATSRNPKWGRKPAHFIVDHLLVQHVEKHIGQIRRNVTQYQQKDRETRS
jgi:uncharacterized damage-inducible protein DinB